MHHDDGPTQAAKKEDPLQRNFNTIVCPSHNLRVESAERLSTTEFRIGISVVLTPHHSLDTQLLCSLTNAAKYGRYTFASIGFFVFLTVM